jgi:hypothetical protein
MNDPVKPDLKTGVPVGNKLDGGQLLAVIDEDDALLVWRGSRILCSRIALHTLSRTARRRIGG